MNEVIRMFSDDETAGHRFAWIRWPDGPVCLHWDSVNVRIGGISSGQFLDWRKVMS